MTMVVVMVVMMLMMTKTMVIMVLVNACVTHPSNIDYVPYNVCDGGGVLHMLCLPFLMCWFCMLSECVV